MARPKKMSKTTFAGIILATPAVMFSVMFWAGKMSEGGYIAGLGVLATFGPVVQGFLSKDDDGVDYKELIDQLKQQLEEMKRQLDELNNKQ